jgi:hypothetical protein
MSVGVGDLARTSAEPNTEACVCVIGNPNFSKAGSSSAFALIPRSTTTVAPIIENSSSHRRLHIRYQLAESGGVHYRSTENCRIPDPQWAKELVHRPSSRPTQIPLGVLPLRRAARTNCTLASLMDLGDRKSAGLVAANTAPPTGREWPVLSLSARRHAPPGGN